MVFAPEVPNARRCPVWPWFLHQAVAPKSSVIVKSFSPWLFKINRRWNLEKRSWKRARKRARRGTRRRCGVGRGSGWCDRVEGLKDNWWDLTWLDLTSFYKAESKLTFFFFFAFPSFLKSEIAVKSILIAEISITTTLVDHSVSNMEWTWWIQH